MSYREFHYHWDIRSQSRRPEKLWPFVADTNRFNRDTSVPAVEVESTKRRLRNARRRVRLSIFGMPVEWEEQPFEWVRPTRFGVTRTYSKGPIAEMKALAELSPNADGGTTFQLRSLGQTKIAAGLHRHSISNRTCRCAKISPRVSESMTSWPRLRQSPTEIAVCPRLV